MIAGHTLLDAQSKARKPKRKKTTSLSSRATGVRASICHLTRSNTSAESRSAARRGDCCCRQHEQLLAQITRTDQWIDRCCRPIRLALRHTHGLLPVSQLIAELETSHPDLFSEMLASSSLLFPVGHDGLMRSARSGRVYWTSDTWSNGFSPTSGNIWCGFPSAELCSIWTAFGNIAMRHAYGRELPSQILRVVEAEPAGKVACQWRNCVEASFLPQIEYVKNLLLEHSATIEW
eukprot:SAG31_NODE_1024_length_10294_cov_7.215400_13_plen_234_part_00